MARLCFSLAISLIFSLLALGRASEFENFLISEDLTSLDNGLETSINKLIDDNIDTIQEVIQEFDPAKLPDIPLMGKGQLSNGWLSNLSKIKRTGDSSLRYADKILSLDLKVGWEKLRYDFNYAFKLWFIQRYGTLQGSIDQIHINLNLYVDFRNYAVVLQQFKIDNVDKIDLKLEGTFGDKLRSLIGKLIVNLAKRPIVNTVEGVASKVIEEKINQLNKQIPNHKRQFTYIDLVQLNRNRYMIDDFTGDSD